MAPEGQQRIEPRLLRKGSKEYRLQLEGIWNRDVPRREPDAILRAKDETDVMDAIRLAREHGWRIAIRGGGHNWFGASLRDGGLLLDLGEMRDLVSVDTDRREAVVEPALTGQDLLRQLEPYGLSFPVGHCGTVPLSGYLLNGGFGWNAVAWGPACLSVRSADIVTADGELVTASADQNPDWYWAVRGASHGFFGVVVRYRIALFPRPRAITTSTCIFPVDRIDEVSAWVTTIRPRLPAHVELTMLLGAVPAALAIDDRHLSHGVVVTATAFSESEEEAKSALAPIAEPPARAGCLQKILHEPTPYEALFRLGSELWPEGYRYRSDNFWYSEPPSAILPRMQSLVARSPDRSFFLCLPLPPPSPGAPPLPDAAFSMVGATFVACYAAWKDPKDDRAAREWYAESVRSLEPSSIGHYIGETDIEMNRERAVRSYTPLAWKRLEELQKRHDPSNRFLGFYGRS